MLCQSCKHCADGVGGHRKCYLDVDNPLNMTSIPYKERENCKWYEYDETPSNKRYSIERCPSCGRIIPAMMIGSGAVRRSCSCGYENIT